MVGGWGGRTKIQESSSQYLLAPSKWFKNSKADFALFLHDANRPKAENNDGKNADGLRGKWTNVACRKVILLMEETLHGLIW